MERVRIADPDYVVYSKAMMTVVAENSVNLLHPLAEGRRLCHCAKHTDERERQQNQNENAPENALVQLAEQA